MRCKTEEKKSSDSFPFLKKERIKRREATQQQSQGSERKHRIGGGKCYGRIKLLIGERREPSCSFSLRRVYGVGGVYSGARKNTLARELFFVPLHAAPAFSFGISMRLHSVVPVFVFNRSVPIFESKTGTRY